MPNRQPKIPPTIKTLIIQEALKEPKRPRRVVAVELQNLIERMGERVPSEDTLVKIISQARNREPNPFDAPWSLGTLTKYDLPPEAIPTIIAIQEIRHNTLDIREAWWVSRLRCLVSSPKVLSIEEVLSLWAIKYASQEEIAEISNTEFDTSELDQIIIAYAEEYAAYPLLFEWIKNNEGIDEAGSTLNLALKVRCEARRRELSDDEKKFIEILAEHEGLVIEYESVNLANKSSPERLLKTYEAKVKLFVNNMFEQQNMYEREVQNERTHSKEG